jgi:parallel beta-helix repeat protein
LNLRKILRQLSIFVVLFVLIGAFAVNPVTLSAHRGSASSAASLSSTGSPDNSCFNSQSFSAVPTNIPKILDTASFIGSLSPNEQLSLQFVLPLSNAVGLDSFLRQVYDPASSLYHHFLTPSQFYMLYGPNHAEAEGLTTYIRSKGMQALLNPANPNLVEVTGTVSQIQDALKTQIDSFSWNGRTFYSATSQAQLPTQLSKIQMIYGLENFDSQLGRSRAFPLYRTLNTVTPGQLYYSGLYYSPSEIRQAYNATALLNAGYNGKGISIAIIDAFGDPFIQQELQRFCEEFKLPLYSGTLHIIPVGPYNPWNGTIYGWSAEVALDVEWAHAMAPNATINLYISADNGDSLWDSVLKATLGYDGTAYGVYDNNIISMSWGTPENDLGSSTTADHIYGLNYPWLNQVLQMDAALGITVFASSGDAGAYDQSFFQTSPYGGASYPSTDPYVTGVGGTSLYMNTTSGYYQWSYANATGTYGNETAWSWNNWVFYRWGTGGGWSTIFSQPSWQAGPGVATNGERGNPDVAWDADPQTGVPVSMYDVMSDSYEYYVIGGTSVGAPCWAGSMALIDQKAGKSLGFINPMIYSILNSTAEYSKAFHDVTAGNNDPYSATKGWDPLTGVGSPNLGELADRLAPTGQLPVVVTNDFSNVLGQAYAYGQVINLTAVVANNRTVTGPVSANLISSTGAAIASDIVLTYSARRGAWLGSYAIKPRDPSGEWQAAVTAINASSSGEGFTTLHVGDGVTIWTPSSWTATQFHQVGDTINVISYVVDTRGNNVTNGAYTATFYLAQNQTAGNRLGKVEARIKLKYIPLNESWQGNLTIPSSVDQSAWLVVVNGTDLNGNMGSAYSWVNVGLQGTIFTDKATYVLGDRIFIAAFPDYANSAWVITGTFTAFVYCGSAYITKLPLTFRFFATGSLFLGGVAGFGWIGAFTPSVNGPSGFYTITVNGTDGKGNCGSFAGVIRVAPYRLGVRVSVPNATIPLRNGHESWILAKITYPDGSPMTTGDVNGLVLLNPGAGYTSPITEMIMTYNSSLDGFVAFNFFDTISVTDSLMWGNPTTSRIGKYIVDVEAYDVQGNYGNGTTSFSVTATPHSAIDITTDAGFTAANGVIGGDGTSNNPYLIAGWNVSSISITNVNSSYELLNDYVSGSGGNGITINTPNSSPKVINVYTLQNQGYGLYANYSPAGTYTGVVAGNNRKDGILITNDSLAGYGAVDNSFAYDNALNGIVYASSSQHANQSFMNEPSIIGDVAIGNAQVGLLSQDTKKTNIWDNLVIGSKVGIEITARQGSWYGLSRIQGNTVENNTIGIYVDGLDQNQTTAEGPSYVELYGNIPLQNNVGMYAARHAVIDALGNLVYYNDIGISTVDSLAYVTQNIVQANFGNGIQIVGQSPFKALKPVDYGPMWFEFGSDFGSVAAHNMAWFNGNATMTVGSGISISNTDSSFVAYNNVFFNKKDGIELNNVTGISLRSPSTFVLGNSELYNIANGLEANNLSDVTLNGEVVEGNGLGILLRSCSNDTIIGNKVIANGEGVKLSYSSNNFVSRNDITANKDHGIALEFSSSNRISGNNITANKNHGLNLDSSTSNSITKNNITNNDDGISLESSFYQSISRNYIANNTNGVYLYSSSGNNLTGNNIANNDYGIWLEHSSSNKIYHNNFIKNPSQASSDPSINFWDDGYPSGGNYWDDYLTRYPNATQIDHTGIGNTPYAISSNNTDRYPLMNTWPSPDIAITSVALSKTIIDQGYSLDAKVSAANLGNFTETFNVTLYANTTAIATQTVTLANGSVTTITFAWNTRGFGHGNYTISAYAWPLPGEINIANNKFTYGSVKVTIPGDVDGDFRVTILDVVRITSIYGHKQGDPNFNSNCDIDGDGKITILDVVICTSHYAQKWP